MGIKVRHKGNFDKTTKWLMNAKERKFNDILDKYGKLGVEALAAATPKDTGLTAASWNYEIHYSNNKFTIVWTNDNMAERGMPVALLIQYGHGTKNGGYVQGIDYINPALTPIFDKLANDAWKEVTK